MPTAPGLQARLLVTAADPPGADSNQTHHDFQARKPNTRTVPETAGAPTRLPETVLVGAPARYPAARAASRMSRVTAAGRETIGRCDARTSTVVEPARCAMNRCSAGEITRSTVPTKYQLRMVFHAGAPDGSFSALAATGRWTAASIAPVFAGRSLANAEGNGLCLT